MFQVFADVMMVATRQESDGTSHHNASQSVTAQPGLRLRPVRQYPVPREPRA
jgi:hypothetical protein